MWHFIIPSRFFDCYDKKIQKFCIKKVIPTFINKTLQFPEDLEEHKFGTFTPSKHINVIVITSSVCKAWLKFAHVPAESALMAVQFINVESFFFLRKFIRPKKPPLNPPIVYFVFSAVVQKKWRPNLRVENSNAIQANENLNEPFPANAL